MSTDNLAGDPAHRHRVRRRYVISALLAVPLLAIVALLAVVATSKPSIALSSQSLATLSTPIGGGSIADVSAVGGREQKAVAVSLRGDEIWPAAKVDPGERITVIVTIKRPGWISWLSGSTQRVTLTETAPLAKLKSTFITRAAGQPVTVKFTRPVDVVGSGRPGTDFDPHAVSSPKSSLTLAAKAPAGTVAVAVAARSWERPETATVSWFPRGKRATVVASPSLGSRISPSTPITLTFSKPVAQVLGKQRPPVNPITPGVWHSVNAHTIVFRPTGYGYGLGATVNVLLPATVELVGAKQGSSSQTSNTTTSSDGSLYPVVGAWTVPQPSTQALQQLLAGLGYLPVSFRAARTPKTQGNPTTTTTGTATTTTDTTTTGTITTGTGTGTTGTQPTTLQTDGASAANAGAADVATTVAAEETAIVHPPKGRFVWRYHHTPGALKQLWSPTDWTELTKGAVMAFESQQGLTVDGEVGPAVWKALINAAVHGQKSTFGYTFVMVTEHEPEGIQVWHNGKIVVHGLVNTGIPAAPTALGTYTVYEHLRVTTMSGLNPNGTPYHDPGIPWVSYFNGGDALHGFIRASYGFPQSLGCVEMPYSQAGQVWPYTPIGTIVNLT